MMTYSPFNYSPYGNTAPKILYGTSAYEERRYPNEKLEEFKQYIYNDYQGADRNQLAAEVKLFVDTMKKYNTFDEFWEYVNERLPYGRKAIWSQLRFVLKGQGISVQSTVVDPVEQKEASTCAHLTGTAYRECVDSFADKIEDMLICKNKCLGPCGSSGNQCYDNCVQDCINGYEKSQTLKWALIIGGGFTALIVTTIIVMKMKTPASTATPIATPTKV